MSDTEVPAVWPQPPARSPYAPSLGTKIFAILVGLAIVPGGLAYTLRYQLGLADGTYAFIETQPGNPDEPVTFPSCLPITYVVDDRREIPGGQKLVDEAIGRVSAATGLRFVALGSIRNAPFGGNVTITWTGPEEIPDLAGDTVGLGGSATVQDRGTGTVFYSSGRISLDAADLGQMEDRDGSDAVRAVIMHELGHVVGLAHVKDRNELMSKTNYGKLDFGPGDKRGLALLGKGGCES